MADVLLPQVAKTGEPAGIEDFTTRESKSQRATVNVRLFLPRRTLVLHAPNGDRATLPRSNDQEHGLAVAQVALGQN